MTWSCREIKICTPKDVADCDLEDGNTEAAVAAGGQEERTQCHRRRRGETAGGIGIGGLERREPAGRASPIGRHQEQRGVALQVR